MKLQGAGIAVTALAFVGLLLACSGFGEVPFGMGQAIFAVA
jgi:hypothetical protein